VTSRQGMIRFVNIHQPAEGVACWQIQKALFVSSFQDRVDGVDCHYG
jgi:hypothetical protein